MISFQEYSFMGEAEGGKNIYYGDGVCLSTDEKPLNMANGSTLLEMDTGTIYAFDAENQQWRALS